MFTIIENRYIMKKNNKKRGKNLKIKELRLLNIKIISNNEIIYQGKTEEVPQELKEKEYNKIYFEGVDVVVEI